MSSEVLQAANAVGLWIISLIIVSIVLLQSVLYAKLSFKVAGEINYPAEKCKDALKAGMITAIGPSIAVFIVMVGMMSVVGTPITWLRLSIIGAASTELTASTVGAQAAGVEFGSAEYGIRALSVSFWTMAANGTGWLIIVALFTHKLEDIRQKLGGGNAKWLGLLSLAAALGCFGYLNTNTIVAALRNMKTNPSAVGSIYAIAGGMAAMAVISKLTQTRQWLKEYSLGIAMLIGMIFATALV
ncbi:MAG: DUF5058 family protein [Synergistaceae bacterium]|jgi:hypothetical protein|nr:DUF5058 family protein [Synergistaceae bacterium]